MRSRGEAAHISPAVQLALRTQAQPTEAGGRVARQAGAVQQPIDKQSTPMPAFRHQTHRPAGGRRHRSAPSSRPPAPAGKKMIRFRLLVQLVPSLRDPVSPLPPAAHAGQTCKHAVPPPRPQATGCHQSTNQRVAPSPSSTGLLGGLNVQHVQDDGLVGAQHGAARNHGADGIADLACRGQGEETCVRLGAGGIDVWAAVVPAQSRSGDRSRPRLWRLQPASPDHSASALTEQPGAA